MHLHCGPATAQEVNLKQGSTRAADPMIYPSIGFSNGFTLSHCACLL